MQTSIEWLIEKLGIKEMYEDSDLPLDSILEQAKEMHKQEMIKFAINYTNDCGEFLMEKNVYEYYLETFKKD